MSAILGNIVGRWISMIQQNVNRRLGNSYGRALLKTKKLEIEFRRLL